MKQETDKLGTVLAQAYANSRKVLQVENVKVDRTGSYSGGGFAVAYALGCEYEGARYHVWIDPISGIVEGSAHVKSGPCLYKNPLRDLKLYQPGYFNTRRLSAQSKFGKRLVSAMLTIARRDDLFRKADQQIEAEDEQNRRQAAESRRLQRIQAAGLELLKPVEALVNLGYCPHCGCDLWNTKGCPMCPIMRDAYEALVRLGEREPRQWAEYVDPDEINLRNMAHHVQPE